MDIEFRWLDIGGGPAADPPTAHTLARRRQLALVGDPPKRHPYR